MNYPSYVKNQQDERAYDQGYIYSEEHATKPIRFFEKYLRHSKGQWAGKPVTLLDWQANDLILPLFGWIHKETQVRRFRRCNTFIAKKNGKSTLASAIGIFMLVADGEAGAEIYSCAVDQNQASIVHGEAITMCEQSPALLKHLKINRSTKNIYFPQKHSFYRALSHDAGSKEGLNIHCAIIDEIHAWKTHDLWQTLLYGTAARSQPLIFVISTAGVFDSEALGYIQYQYTKKVRDHEVEDIHLLPVIYEASEEDDWTSENTWKKANPSYGATISQPEMSSAVKEAQQIPRLENTFRRYRLNQWVQSAESWLSISDWDACQEIEEDLTPLSCHGGLDLSSHNDISAFCLVWEKHPIYYVKHWYFLPQDNIQKLQDEHHVPYLQWVKDKYLILTPGDTIDHEFIETFIVGLSRKFKIKSIAFDIWNSESLAQQLASKHRITTVKFPQNPSVFNEPSKQVETLLSSNRIAHDHSPVTRWMIGNVTLREDTNGCIMPSKKRSAGKIDGVTSMVMALARSLYEPKKGSGPLISFI